MNLKLAVQMYTLRDYTKSAHDFANALAKIRDIGYTGVQLSAVGCMNGESPEVNAQTAKKMLDDHGLRCVATHRSWDDLCNHTDREIEFHHILDCPFVAIGGLPRERYHVDGAAGYRRFLKEARPVAEKLRKAGIRFGYHNHAHEFIPGDKVHKTCYDILIEEGKDFLDIEIDTYWVVHAGGDPVAYIQRCSGRLPVVHLKDKAVHMDQGPVMAPIGEGNLNWDAIIPAFAQAGTEWMAVEQDQCFRDPFDCLRSSYQYLHNKFGIT